MTVPVSLTIADVAKAATPFLIVPIGTTDTIPDHLSALDASTGGALGAAWSSGDFSGKRDQQTLVYSAGERPRVFLVGMGPEEDMSAAVIRRAAMIGGKRARKAGVESASLLVPETSLADDSVAQALAEGLPYGAWHYPHLKLPADPPKPDLEKFEIVATEASDEFKSGMARGIAIAEGQSLTRELQVLPADRCTPIYLAEQAKAIAERHSMKLTVLDQAALEKEGMGALLAVAQGSANPPRFIILEHEGNGGKPVVLVGKGVTFDTGGVSIKPANGMEEMKYDMSGAAAVLGTMEAVGRLNPSQRVIALVPSAENMVSSTAYRPGDVVKSHFGKTIEVINTDAEGRLLLADALSYARRLEPAAVIDCATLTGAVVVGLGHTVSAVMGTDDDLIRDLIQAGEQSDERLWELPLWDEYRDLIKSDIADVKNSGGRAAGSITAGWFLREFVEGFPWAHIDIAGTAYLASERPTQGKGATGVLVRTFSEYLLGRS